MPSPTTEPTPMAQIYQKLSFLANVFSPIRVSPSSGFLSTKKIKPNVRISPTVPAEFQRSASKNYSQTGICYTTRPSRILWMNDSRRKEIPSSSPVTA